MQIKKNIYIQENMSIIIILKKIDELEIPILSKCILKIQIDKKEKQGTVPLTAVWQTGDGVCLRGTFYKSRINVHILIRRKYSLKRSNLKRL
mgnify:CR=1 FL=1